MPWKLEHVQLAIGEGDEERCDAFYVGLLGFRVLDKPPVLAARGGRWYQRDDAILHLGVVEVFSPAKKAHPAFVVDDYDGLLSRLSAAGVNNQPDENIPGRRRCYVHDPVGNRIELIDGAVG
ncbi:MAG TPA: VOC family protein [Acidimicrobiales bacterium]|jgi:catechol 2,3-dioxygenase-like lactoylglutathione lyase family enzyme|nr:VOC family protein [Acidimicrobiales bacterium]